MTANAKRARWAQAALDAYHAAVGNNTPEIVDLLADLLHLAAQCEEDPIATVARAIGHYQEERCESRSS